MAIIPPYGTITLYCQYGTTWNPATPGLIWGTLTIAYDGGMQATFTSADTGVATAPLAVDYDDTDFSFTITFESPQTIPAAYAQGRASSIVQIAGSFENNTKASGNLQNGLIWIGCPAPQYVPSDVIPVYIGSNQLGSMKLDGLSLLYQSGADNNPTVAVGYLVPPFEHGRIYAWLTTTDDVKNGAVTYTWLHCKLTSTTAGSGKLYSTGPIVRDAPGARGKRQDDSWSSSPQIR